jgi:DNA-binding MarR family transcriptional regulator
MAPAATKVRQRPVPEGPAFLLARLGRVAARRLHDRLAKIGLKPPHAAILVMLRDSGPMSQQDLGERLHVDPSNLVNFLNPLEEGGLVVRRRDPADRRRHIVEITEEGSKRVPACDGPIEALENELFAGLSADDRRQLQRILGEIQGTMLVEEPPPEDESDFD